MAKRAKKRATKKAPAKKYSAAGFDRVGIDRIINEAEGKRRGRPGHPWSKALKNRMVKSCDGKRTMAEVHAKIDELAAAK